MCSFLNIKVQMTLVLTLLTLGNKLISDSTLYFTYWILFVFWQGFFFIVGYDQIYQDCIL